MSKLKITLFQTNIIWEDPDCNLTKLEKVFEEQIGTELIILPELFSTGFTINTANYAEDINGKTISRLKMLSSKYNVSICGSIIISETTDFYNRFFFVTPEGDLFQYNKRHLFRMGEENLYYKQGIEKTIINYKGVRILPLICYDLRFPVWSRYVDDYDFLVYIANWPAVRRLQWDTLLKARAIENQCFVAGVNRIGVDGRNIIYNGGTQFINPDGEVVVCADDNSETFVNLTLDLEKCKILREKFPVWKDKDSFEIFM